ncbi:MAG: universal stress protein, partial [Thaumarchaeota archaeon]|nr:universal stress protein [Nitrososphaerota archaeon]
DESKKWFEQISKKAKEGGIEVKTEFLDAAPSIVGAITNYAENENVDLIIVGTRGRTGFKKILLGSVASGIVTYATCPVMVIK